MNQGEIIRYAIEKLYGRCPAVDFNEWANAIDGRMSKKRSRRNILTSSGRTAIRKNWKLPRRWSLTFSTRCCRKPVTDFRNDRIRTSEYYPRCLENRNPPTSTLPTKSILKELCGSR